MQYIVYLSNIPGITNCTIFQLIFPLVLFDFVNIVSLDLSPN